MTASPNRVPTRRAQLGSPVVSVTGPARYLRHRAAADAAYRARQRAQRRNRLIIAVVVGLFYFLIGRDLFALAKAKKDSASMQVRSDTHQLADDVTRIARAGRLASDQNIPGLASTPPVGQEASPRPIASPLSARPVDPYSRASDLK